jgi:hypothetical protein
MKPDERQGDKPVAHSESKVALLFGKRQGGTILSHGRIRTIGRPGFF